VIRNARFHAMLNCFGTSALFKMCRYLAVSLAICLLAPMAFAARRNTIPFDQNWKFHRGDPENALEVKFEDAAWDSVSLPHTWNTDTDPPQAGYYRGPGWYRKTFRAPADWKAHRVFVRFGAASLVAQVFLNGIQIGEHKGGFAAFCFELTPYLRLGSANIIAVRVDNSRREDVIPLGGDFTVFGGLYRSALLIVTGPVIITPLNHASSGVLVRQKEVSSSRADLDITTEVSNGDSVPRMIGVRVTVKDARNSVVATARRQLTLSTGQTRSVAQPLMLTHPHLWDGTADPYLYSVHVELIADGSTVDTVAQPLGLRYFRFDSRHGLILNGKRVEVHGVCRHQDWAGVGWAIGPREQDIDMRLMRQMGVNAVRLAHYQHNDYFYQLTDRYGLIVWAELAMVDWMRDTAALRENARQQLIELIRQNINHPSILMWSLYNEINPSNTADPAPLVRELKELANKEDPSRPTTGALSIDGIEKLHRVGELNDLLALNVYPGWYIQTPDDMGPIADKWNEAYGARGIIISEYGAGASIHQHQQDFSGRTGRAPNSWHPEEWQSIVHEGNYRQIRQRPFIFGAFIWNMFDFASANRKEGDQVGINDKGLVTRDRKVRKDAYFLYQANWTAQPMLYITSHRDSTRSAADTPVKVFSNCDEVSLDVNGRRYGNSHPTDLHVFRWDHITLTQGENHVQATGTCHNQTVHDEVTWTYHPQQP